MRYISEFLFALTVAVIFSLPAGAQDFPSNTTIASCADVKCPTAPNSVAAQCIVVDKTFTVIGQARVPVEPSSSSNGALAELSWVQGVAVVDRPGIDRVYDNCAVFFTRVSDTVSFDDDDISLAQGTCPQALSSECVTALITRAKTVDVTGLSSEDACATLQEDFQANLDPACAKFATGTRWDGIVTAPLSGAGAAQAITSTQNSTSNCWPVIPRQSSLTLVKSFQAKGDILTTTMTKVFYNITPILTFFHPTGRNAIVDFPEAQLTCLKTIDLSVGNSATRSPGNADRPSSAALISSNQTHVTIFLSTFVLVALFSTF